MKQKIKNLLAEMFGYKFRGTIALANVAEGTHEDCITKLADAAISTRFLLVKFGTDVNHIAANGESDKPLGVCTDEPSAAEEPANVDLLGTAMNTRKMVASEIIAYNEDVYTAASGKVQGEPSAAGTYYKVGRALTASTTDGDVIEVEPCLPLKYVVTE